MKMSKAQFVFIASALKDAAEIAVRTSTDYEAKYSGDPSGELLRKDVLALRVSLATTFAARLALTNPKFDRQRFVTAVAIR